MIVAIWDILGLISRCHSSLWGFVHICVKYDGDVIIGYWVTAHGMRLERWTFNISYRIYLHFLGEVVSRIWNLFFIHWKGSDSEKLLTDRWPFCMSIDSWLVYDFPKNHHIVKFIKLLIKMTQKFRYQNDISLESRCHADSKSVSFFVLRWILTEWQTI